MDRIFIVYNYYTLGKALSLIRNNESIGDDTIIYYAKDTHPFNSKIRSACNIVLIRYGNEIAKMRDGDYILQFPKSSIIQILNNWINSNLLGRKILYIVKNTIKDTPSILYVFKDNHSGEASAIEWTKKNRKLCENILIEEGLALYTRESSKPQKIKYYHIKRVISFLLGTSAYPIFKKPQGFHPNLNAIYCSNPTALQTSNRHQVDIRKEPNYFHQEFSIFYCQSILSTSESLDCLKDCTYVFITQALVENNILNKDDYIRVFKFIIEIVSRFGKVLVKSHPRETIDYQKYIAGENIVFCSREIGYIPFQALYYYLKKPRVITFYSSVGIMNSADKILFTYPLLNCKNINKAIDSLNYSFRNIVVAYNEDDIINFLSNFC